MTTISFIIPAYEEAEHIGRTISSVRDVVPASHLAEIIVCDHGSGDDTVAIAEAAGATVHVWNDGTIAKQRNRGAELATGEVFVFLDADTSLTAEWADALPQLLERLEAEPLLVTGSHPGPPEPGTWLERHWFAHIAGDAQSKHLGSAHLIFTREHFEAIGGFDETLETGEDFEICVRAARLGGRVEGDRSLRAVHHDFPRDLISFVRREAWHGRGNFASWQMVRSSPVALGTVAFAGLHLAAGAALLLRPRLVVLPAAAIAALCGASSLYKFRGAPLTSIAVNGGVFYFYYLGRSLALARALTEPADPSADGVPLSEADAAGD